MTAPFLIEAEDLAREIDAGDVQLLDTRRPAEFAKGHIAGAINFSTYDVFATDTRPEGLAAFAQDMATRYLTVGVSATRPVVVYEEDTGMRAARDAWILQFLGHPGVRLLHGGLAAWRGKGYQLSEGLGEEWTIGFRAKPRPELVIRSDEVARRLGSGDLVLLDVRDESEHKGRDHTACCARRGHIPGSVWIDWTEFLEGGRFKSPQAIRDLLASRRVAPEREIAPYCHRGARSAAVYYALRYAGIANVRNFIGSWHEWSARPSLPIAN